MNKKLMWPMLFIFAIITCCSHAAEKITVTINKQVITAYRTVDLEAAKKEAADKDTVRR